MDEPAWWEWVLVVVFILIVIWACDPPDYPVIGAREVDRTDKQLDAVEDMIKVAILQRDLRLAIDLRTHYDVEFFFWE